MCNQQVNGYTNFDTFTVAHIIDNTRWLNDHWSSVARSYLDAGLSSEDLAASLEHLVTLDASGQLEKPSQVIIRALLDAALNSVDWQDIADTLWTSAKEERDYRKWTYDTGLEVT
jgi:hypothetical protein